MPSPARRGGGPYQGRVLTYLDRQSIADSVVLQPDGKIIVAGEVFLGAQFFLGLARYNTDGTLDASFGSGGTLTNVAGLNGGVALQPDGKILQEGWGHADLPGSTLLRYNPDGTPDASFGSGGQVFTAEAVLSF